MTRLTPNPDVLAGDVEDDVVLVNVGTGRVFTLNRTGYRIWQLVGEGFGREQVETTMLAEFDVEPAELRQEIDGCLRSLLDERLLVEADGPDT